jgi:hypothetical protein
MTNDECLMVAAYYVFPAHTNPGDMDTIVVGMKAAQITELNRVHAETTHV